MKHGKVQDRTPWKNLTIQYQVEMKIFFKVKGVATNTDFIGSMHTGMSLCFHWNVFKYAVVCFIGLYLIFIYKCCLIIR